MRIVLSGGNGYLGRGLAERSVDCRCNEFYCGKDCRVWTPSLTFARADSPLETPRGKSRQARRGRGLSGKDSTVGPLTLALSLKGRGNYIVGPLTLALSLGSWRGDMLTTFLSGAARGGRRAPRRHLVQRAIASVVSLSLRTTEALSF